MASIQKRVNEAKWVESRQRWQIKVQCDGERKMFTSSLLKCDSCEKEICDKAVDCINCKNYKKGKIEAEKKADTWIENRQSKDRRFEPVWEEFLEETKLLTSNPNYNNLECLGRIWLLPTLKHKLISKISESDWQDCINDAHKKGRAEKTLKNIRGAISSFCTYVRRKKMAYNPPDIIIPKNAPVGERNILQPENLKTLFSVDYIIKDKKKTKCYYIHAWRFAALTGLRRGELCGLKKTDIDGSLMYIKRAINDDLEITRGKNKNARRYMPLPDLAMNVLSDQHAMLKSKGIISPWLFPDEHGEMLNPHHLYNHWVTYRRQHGISCSIKELRNTMISISQSGVPRQQLKRMVGHSEAMDTYGIYARDVEGELERASATLNDIFTRLLT